MAADGVLLEHVHVMGGMNCRILVARGRKVADVLYRSKNVSHCRSYGLTGIPCVTSTNPKENRGTDMNASASSGQTAVTCRARL
jgi:hypothetical protein